MNASSRFSCIVLGSEYDLNPYVWHLMIASIERDIATAALRNSSCEMMI